MNLFQYFQKNVVIQDCNGVIWHGFVTAYTPAIDAEDEREEIAIKKGRTLVRTRRGLIGFHEEEIRSIKVVKDERE